MGAPNVDPGIASTPSEGAESAQALWVRNFLTTQPGKTYKLESTDDAREAGASHGVEVAARALTDDVVRSARVDGQGRSAAAPEELL